MGAPSSDKAGIRQTIRALRAAGYELDSVDDGDYYDPAPGIDSDGDQIVNNEDQAIAAITAVDDARLYVRRDGRKAVVRFVMGNDPDEVICDHSTSLSAVLDPLIDSWME